MKTATTEENQKDVEVLRGMCYLAARLATHEHRRESCQHDADVAFHSIRQTQPRPFREVGEPNYLFLINKIKSCRCGMTLEKSVGPDTQD